MVPRYRFGDAEGGGGVGRKTETERTIKVVLPRSDCYARATVEGNDVLRDYPKSTLVYNSPVNLLQTHDVSVLLL